MSSFGGQWRVIRHYLSMSNLNAEVEKLVKRVKPATPEQWDNLIRKFEKAISIRLTQDTKEIEADKIQSKETTVQNDVQAKADKKTEGPKELLAPHSEGLSVGAEAKDITFESIMQGLKLKKDLHFGKLSQPSWKSNRPTVTKSSIQARTSHVIAAMAAAEGATSAAARAEQLVQHLLQYPEARDYAIKEGAIRTLLRAQYKFDDEPELQGILNEALVALGRPRRPRARGPNVLSIDGGGMRGLIAIELLRQLEIRTGRRVTELFDLIVGVSTGAIIAAVIGSGVGTLDTAYKMYMTLSKEMFGNTSIIGGASRLVWSHSYYDTAAWERLLRDYLGDLTLSQCNRRHAPLMALVSCVVGGGALSPYLFRTYGAAPRTRPAWPGAASARVWQAVRASAAAPTYFEEFRLGAHLHQDGGLMVNNPTGVALHEARLLYGSALRRGTLVSVGTGRAPAAPAAHAAHAASSWRDKFDAVLQSATDTQAVHVVVGELLRGRYYRFNPPLVQPCAMDEVDDRKLQAMMEDTHAYIRRNQHKFAEAAARLTRRRPLLQRAADAAHDAAQRLGLARDH